MSEMNILLHNGAMALVNNKPFMILLVTIGFDYLTGVLKSAFWKVSDSSVGFKGLIKHTIVIVLFAIVWIIAESYNAAYLAYGLEMLYMMNYIISILENFAVMGIYQPEFLKVKIQKEIKRYEKQLEDLIDKETGVSDNDDKGTGTSVD